MAWITHCPKCGRAYEESSRENADSPMRMCSLCWLTEQGANDAQPE